MYQGFSKFFKTKAKINFFILIFLCAFKSAHSLPGEPNNEPTNCAVLVTPSEIGISYTALTVSDSNQLYRINSFSNFPVSSYFVNNGVLYNYISFETTAPTTQSLTPITNTLLGEPILTMGDSITIFLSAGADSENRVCTVSYNLAFDGTNYIRSNFEVYNRLAPAPTRPTEVPIFTPFGIVIIISGMLWIGRRSSFRA